MVVELLNPEMLAHRLHPESLASRDAAVKKSRHVGWATNPGDVCVFDRLNISVSSLLRCCACSEAF